MQRTTKLVAAAASIIIAIGVGTILAEVGDGYETRRQRPDPESRAELLGGGPLELADAQIFIEINSTDGDAGIQVKLDGEGWDSMQAFDPDGNPILDILASNAIGLQGITELFFESAEPSFDEQPLEELLELFPEGEYTFAGTTTDGEPLIGTATLTHALPEGPIQLFPVGGETVDPTDAVLIWEAADDSAVGPIVAYEVIVATEDGPLREFKVDVSGTTTRVGIPTEFLEPETAYKWEVLAIEESGNQTISEAEFETGASGDDDDDDSDSGDDDSEDGDGQTGCTNEEQLDRIEHSTALIVHLLQQRR